MTLKALDQFQMNDDLETHDRCFDEIEETQKNQEGLNVRIKRINSMHRLDY